MIFHPSIPSVIGVLAAFLVSPLFIAVDHFHDNDDYHRQGESFRAWTFVHGAFFVANGLSLAFPFILKHAEKRGKNSAASKSGGGNGGI